MRTFMVFFAALFFAVSLILGTAVVIGRAQPLPSRLTDLRLTDCTMPCWLGIIPGTTTLDEAAQQLHSAFNDKSPYRVDYDPTSRDGLVIYTLFPRSAIPGLVSVTFIAQDRRTVDTILLRFEMADEAQVTLNPRI